MPIDASWGQEQKTIKIKTSAEYNRYLQGEHWQEVKSLALDEAYHCCKWCGKHSSKLQVHHKHYNTLGRERLSDLLVLCPRCHMKAHKKRGW